MKTRMSEIADDGSDATIVTGFVYDRNKTEQKLCKLCFDATVPRSEVVFMSQTIKNLFFLSFCIYKLSLTQLSCGKNLCIRKQPHAAQTLLDNSIKHKKPELSYLN